MPVCVINNAKWQVRAFRFCHDANSSLHTFSDTTTIGYAFASYWGACARLSLHKSFNSQWNVYYGILGGVYGVLQREISPQPMYAPYLGLIFLCSRHWGINAEVAPLFLHSFIENQVVTPLPVLSLGVMQIF